MRVADKMTSKCSFKSKLLFLCNHTDLVTIIPMVPSLYYHRTTIFNLETQMVNGDSDSKFEVLIVQIAVGFPDNLSGFGFSLLNPIFI